MRVPWSRLIRFECAEGRILRGEPILPHPDFDLGKTTAETKLQAKVIVGDIFDENAKVSDEVVTVKKLLGPLTTDDVDILRCVGLNYATHSACKAKYPLCASLQANTSKSEKLVESRRRFRLFSSNRRLVSMTMIRTSSFPA